MTWSKASISKALIAIALLAFYLTGLRYNWSESARRSLHLQEEDKLSDHVRIIIRVTDVNTETGEVAARISFRPAGRFARDEVTPAVNLKLLFNSLAGAQEIDFPRGRRMNPTVAVFALDGNKNKYPFDQYHATLWLLLTTPGRVEAPAAPPPEKRPDKKNDRRKDKGNDKSEAQTLPVIGQFAVGTAALQRSEPVPIVVDLSAGVPGLRFTGNITRNPGQEVTAVLLNLERAQNVIVLSITVMAMMGSLALSMFVMTLLATRVGRELDVVPLSLSVTLLFGLPALRSIQPDAPAVGAFGDYIAFIWAELIVAASAVVIIWTWILRSHLNPSPSQIALAKPTKPSNTERT